MIGGVTMVINISSGVSNDLQENGERWRGKEKQGERKLGNGKWQITKQKKKPYTQIPLNSPDLDMISKDNQDQILFKPSLEFDMTGNHQLFTSIEQDIIEENVLMISKLGK